MLSHKQKCAKSRLLLQPLGQQGRNINKNKDLRPVLTVHKLPLGPAPGQRQTSKLNPHPNIRQNGLRATRHINNSPRGYELPTVNKKRRVQKIPAQQDNQQLAKSALPINAQHLTATQPGITQTKVLSPFLRRANPLPALL
jgi:hypothetical protein